MEDEEITHVVYERALEYKYIAYFLYQEAK